MSATFKPLWALVRVAGVFACALALCAGLAGSAHAQSGGDSHSHGAGDSHSHGADADHSHAAAGHGGHGDPSAHFNWFDLGYASKDINGGTYEEGEEHMSPPFVLMLANVAIVLFILMWKVRPLIQQYVRKRHTSIKEALEEAARLREEAQQRLDDYNTKIDAAEKEIDDMVAKIRASAEAEKVRIVAEAEAQAEAMKKDAEQRIAAEIEGARASLEREVVAAAVMAAEILVRDKATAADQVKIVDSFISDLKGQARGEAAKS